jgi:hypothetical protein
LQHSEKTLVKSHVVCAIIINESMIWVVSSWKKGSHEHLIFIILVIHLSIYLLFIRFGLHLLHLTYGLFLEWWMTCLATLLTWWIAIFQRSSLVLKLINNNFTAWNLIFLEQFFLIIFRILMLGW